MDQTAWINDYNALKQARNNLLNQMENNKNSTLLNSQQIQVLMLENLINKQILTAYTPETLDLYNQYKNQIIPVRGETINGVFYNNNGAPPEFDQNTLRGYIGYKLATGAKLWSDLAGGSYDGMMSIFDQYKGNVRAACEYVTSDKLLGAIVIKILKVPGATPTVRLQNETLGYYAGEATKIQAAALCNWLLGPKITYPDLLSFDVLAPSDNPIIFTLNTDTPNLKPASPDALGGTSGTFGLLGCGAGYDYFMLSDFVNKNGGAFVGATCITANGMRVGNLTPSTFDQIVNVIRNTVFTSSTISSNLLADAAQSLSLGYAYKTVPYIDPLTLDAGNDGVRLSAAPVNFDLNADGVAEALPWTAPTDPLLVMDVNGDGKINNGTELVDLTDSGKPLNLFRLDSNGDGVLNASDAAYWNLQLWQDRNQDGYASPEERQSLADTSIVSIDLNPAHLQTATVAGKANVKGVTATYTDGSTHILWDVPFDSATAATATSSSYAIGINKVSGSGQTALVAMSALGVTLDLNGSGADQAIGGAGNDTLIGTGGDDWLIGGGGSNTYVGGAGSDLLVITADDQQANIDGGAGIDTVVVADDRGVMLNLAQAHVEVVYGGYGNDVFIGGGADNYFIDGAANDADRRITA
jgi:hypothetical protein